uniref:DUF7746 domain-containing protein n=1 Tax=Lactuca sativa TaxID=4236 RepID=A0A9R1WXE7_LACSA|nr:hypothetical protein LSAT_V11C800397280 [Lactuca sativa]
MAEVCFNKKDEASSSNYSNVSFVPYQIEGNFNLGNKDLIYELEKRLSKLNIKNINTLKQIATDEFEDINSDSEIDTNEFSKNKINQSERNTFGKNQKPTLRHYWNRHSLPDVQIEERAFQYDRSAYDGTSVYEWNIDGNTQLQIVNIILSGFTGTLKGWWISMLHQKKKNGILTATKTIIKHENGQHIQTLDEDMVNTLIFAIIKNFVGDLTMFQEKTSEILMNLHCRKLTDFRWYKDNYFVKVFSRLDCKEAYWKERFIAGLPKLFAERVRQKLRESFNNQIPYQNLTYGYLINYINKE